MVSSTLFLLILLLATGHGERRSRKLKDIAIPPPIFAPYASDQLPSDKQITAYLHKGETKTFFYWSMTRNQPLSITMITCASPVMWTIKYRNNSSDSSRYEQQLVNLTTNDVYTFHMTAMKKLYVLQVVPVEQDTYIHLYVSTEVGGAQALQTPIKNLKLIKRQQRKKLTIKWNQSLVDPQGTHYCLVVNPRRHYQTLCAAQMDVFGVQPPPPFDRANQPRAASQTITAWETQQHRVESLKEKEPPTAIACVGPRTHHTLTQLRQGQGYYFDLFAINQQSNLTYAYGSAFTIFNKHVRAIRLTDGKSTYVNLKKLDGKAVFRHKIGKVLSDSFKLYVIPCGGSVDVEISVKGDVVLNQRRIEGFDRLVIPNPPPGTRYYIKILPSNGEELMKLSGVEVLATTRANGIPLPNMPADLAVQEYAEFRRCDSVTVGWLASPGHRLAHYCLVIKEGKLRESESFRLQNQCGLETRLKKSADFTVKYCRDMRQNEEKVIVQKIDQLKKGKSYVVQVTVKKPKGKTLSYDLLQVHTKPTCDRNRKNHSEKLKDNP